MAVAVSVVISTHNPNEPRLQRTLAGLRAQTLPLDRWQLVLVDNASTDPAVFDRYDLSWHPNGKLWVSGTYDWGERTGTWATFGDDGAEIASQAY